MKQAPAETNDQQPSLGDLVDRIRGHGDAVHQYVTLTARHHEEGELVVRHAAALGFSQASSGDGESIAVSDFVAQSERLLEELQKRLQHAQELVETFPSLQEEFERLAAATLKASERSERMAEHLSLVSERLGPSEGLDVLRELPARVQEDAEAARRHLGNLRDELEGRLEERLTAIAETRLDEIGRVATALVQQTRDQLQHTEEQVARLDASVRTSAKRLRQSWKQEQKTYRDTLQQTIAAHQEAASAINAALRQRLQAHEEAVQRADQAIRDHFQDQVLQMVHTALGERLVQYERQIDTNRDYLSLHVEQASREAEDKLMLLRSHMHQLEHRVAMAQGHVHWLQRRVGIAALMLIMAAGGALAWYYFRSPTAAGDVWAGMDSATYIEYERELGVTDDRLPLETWAYDMPDADAATPEPESSLLEDGLGNGSGVPVSRGPVDLATPDVEQTPAADEPSALRVEGQAAPDTGYVWILASAATALEAEHIISGFIPSEAGYTVYPTTVDGRMRYRVGTGFFADKQAAESARGDFSYLPEDAWLLRTADTRGAAE